MINIGVIPLDSRPCNTTWLTDLGRIANANVVLYPRNKCGNLFKGAELDDMLTWISNNYLNLDYLIISTDGLSFGGLIQARLAKIDLEETLKKFKLFEIIKDKKPNLKIYLFDTVMRTSITSIDKETEKYWARMNRYSQLRGLCHYFNKDEDNLELLSLEKEIPSHIINTYLKARKVKLTLNEYFLNLLDTKIVDYMILLQEDSMPYGIQKIDQDYLQEIIREKNLSTKVQFYNGTDEGGAVLLGKILLEENKRNPKVYIHFPSKNIIEKTFLFEDRPFVENIEKMCKSMGFIKVEDEEQADFILSIFGIDKNIDLNLTRYIEIPINKDDNYYRYVYEVNEYIDNNKKVVLVDLMFPNGGSVELLKDINYRKLCVYSAWNTASNSLGSAMCQIAAFLCNSDIKLNHKFLLERVMDDCIYQYVARRKASEILLDKGINIYNLKDNHDYALELVKKYLKEYDDMIDYCKYEVELPWNRMFEAEIIIKSGE